MRILSNKEQLFVSGGFDLVKSSDAVSAYTMVGAIVGVGAGMVAMPLGGLVPPLGAMVGGAIGGAVTLNLFGNYTYYGAATGAFVGLCSTFGAAAGMEGAMAMSVLGGMIGLNAAAAFWG